MALCATDPISALSDTRPRIPPDHPNAGLQRAKRPTVPGGFVLPVQAPGGVAGYLLAQARHGARPAGLAVVQHVATVASLQLTILRHDQEALRRESAETLARIAGRSAGPSNRPAAARAGRVRTRGHAHPGGLARYLRAGVSRRS